MKMPQRIALAIALLVTACSLFGQGNERRAYINVEVAGTASGTDFQLQGGAQTLATTISGSYESIPITATLRVMPGRITEFTVSSPSGAVWNAEDNCNYTVNLAAPNGYTIYVDQNADGIPEARGTTVSAQVLNIPENYAVVVGHILILEDRMETAALAGQLTRLEVGDFLMEIGLGTLKNGKSAGRLQLRSDGTTMGYYGLGSELLVPSGVMLACFPEAGLAKSVNGNNWTLETGQVRVEATYVQASKYALSFKAWVSGSYSAAPYAVYTIEKITTGLPASHGLTNPDCLKITEEQGTGGSLVSVVHYVLRSTGADEWLLVQGTGGEERRQKHDNSVSGSTRTETITTGTVSAAEAVARLTWTTAAGAERLTEQLVRVAPGSDVGALVTAYAYFGSGSEGDKGKIQTITDPSGATVTYDYYDSGAKVGEIQSITEPWSDGAGNHYNRVTTFDYDGPSGAHHDYLKSVVVTIGGNEVARTELDNTFDATTCTSTVRHYHGSGSWLTSYRKAYRKDASYFLAGRLLKETFPEGRQYSYAYEQLGGGGSRTLVVEGSHLGGDALINAADTLAIEAIYVLNGKSTLTEFIRDAGDAITSEKISVRTASGFDTGKPIVQSTTTWFDAVRRNTTTQVNGAQRSWSWNGAYLASETDETGLRLEYGYDSVGRVDSVLRTGVAAHGSLLIAGQSATLTSYTYNSLNLKASAVEAGGALGRGATFQYDAAGRLTSTFLPDGRTSTVGYDFEGSAPKVFKVTESLSCGGSVVTCTLPDGKRQSVVTSGVDEYFRYSVNSGNGRIATEVRYGADTQTRYVQTETDWLGRIRTQTRPGAPGQVNVAETRSYDDGGGTGRLTKIERTGLADEYRGYDTMGRLTRTGLDLGGNGLSVADGSDRVTNLNTRFETVANEWWTVDERSIYAKASDLTEGAATSLGLTRRQLTGLTGGASRIQTLDRFGHTTTTDVSVDAGARLALSQTTLPGVSTPARQYVVNGRLVREQTPDGRTADLSYDALGRLEAATDSRNGAMTYSYDNVSGEDTDRLHAVYDPKGFATITYGYDQGGRVNAQVTPTSAQYFKYDCAGRIIKQWGAAAPARYEYNDFGERVKMYTFRNDDGATYAGAGNEPPDTGGTATEWSYHAPSGLLEWKKDGATQQIDFSYNSRGLVASRLWARTAGGNRVGTTYGYLPGSTEVTSVTYSDGSTANLGFQYTRAGLLDQVTDGTGTRMFAYTSALAPDKETLPAYFGNRVLTRAYDAYHRPAGFQLGTAGDPDADLTRSLALAAATGLLSTVQTQAASLPARTFTYGYLSGTALVDTLSTGSGGSLYELDWGYEADNKRDLVASLEARYGAAAVTRYDYTYNNARQRVSSKQSGSAFADYGDATFWRYYYNIRGELEDAVGYLGGNVESLAASLPGRHFQYRYDTLGNRKSMSQTGPTPTDLVTTLARNDLNQIGSRDNPYVPVSGTTMTGARVVVAGVLTDQEGRFWSGGATLNNNLGPARGGILVQALKPGSPDLIQTVSDVPGQIAQDPETLTYDADGNLDEDGQWDYTWDAENRLKTMTSTLPTSGGYFRRRLEFTYDYLGRRVEKQVTDLTTSAVSARRYVYDGWNLVAELAVSGGAAGGVVRSYTWGLDVSGTLGGAGGIGALVQFTVHAGTSTTDYYPSYDGQGNVTALIRSDGVLAAAYEYGPFGEMLRAEVSDTTVADNPFRHATKFTDLESGLVYYGLRYYSPSLGRFINRDPIGEQGGVNLYAFVGNDPVNRWDYLGLDDEAPNLTKCIWVKEGGEWVLKCDDADDGATKLEPFEVRGDRVHGYTAPYILLHIPNVTYQFYGPGSGNGGGSPGGGSPNGGDPSAPNKLGDDFREKQEYCQKLGAHIANLKQSIRAGIQDLGGLSRQFQTADFLNQAQLVGTLLGGAGGVVVGVRHAATSASTSVLIGWMRAAGSPMPRSMLPTGVRDFAQASAGFAADAALRGAPTGLVLDYAYTEAASNELPPVGVILAPGGSTAEAIVSMIDTAAGRVMNAIQNQQLMLATSMAAYERDCK